MDKNIRHHESFDIHPRLIRDHATRGHNNFLAVNHGNEIVSTHRKVILNEVIINAV